MKKFIFSLSLMVISWSGYSQVGIGTLTPHFSTMLEVKSDTAGFLPPRLTNEQMQAISWKALAGLLVYNSTYNQFFFFKNVSDTQHTIKYTRSGA